MPNGKSLGRIVEILLVEDSPSDALLTKQALKLGKVKNKLHHVEDGVEALAFLRKEGDYAEMARPDVVLLDLNMPRKNGREVLQEIRADENLKTLPVIVLTTSDDERDVHDAYGLSANCYITKPVDMAQFTAAMVALDQFWLTWVMLPTQQVQGSNDDKHFSG
ncbi:MAG: response regulator [Planctomycetes bacterium]|nr:response regulator [Planctomycetota bacterium]